MALWHHQEAVPQGPPKAASAEDIPEAPAEASNSLFVDGWPEAVHKNLVSSRVSN
jgi:hypothetical protein